MMQENCTYDYLKNVGGECGFSVLVFLEQVNDMKIFIKGRDEGKTGPLGPHSL